MPYSLLPGRGLLALTGPDAADFLQGLITNDVRRLKDGAVYAAMLTPQGKFLHDFFLLPWGDAVLLDCEKSRLAELQQRLSMYKLRAKVTIDAKPELSVAAAWGEKVSGVGCQVSEKIFADPRLPELGYRIYGDAPPSGTADYERMRLESGVPDGRDMVADKSLLLEFGFEDLHGVDFNKGCYVGQEITARSKHRGSVRRFIYKVEAEGPLPGPGAPVMRDDKPAGELRSCSGNIGLALLSVAEVENAQTGNAEFHCGTVSFKASLPQWVAHPPKALAVPG